MKWLSSIAPFCIIIILSSCSDPSPSPSAAPIDDNEDGIQEQLAMLKVDYTTHEFEGGIVVDVDQYTTPSQYLPILTDYVPAGDFGEITLYYGDDPDPIFDGTIIWMGTGEQSIPKSLNPPSFFDKLNAEINTPPASRFQIIHEVPGGELDYDGIWSGIADLRITFDFLDNNNKIGLFLYTPSVGVGDPTEWDWYIILRK